MVVTRARPRRFQNITVRFFYWVTYCARTRTVRWKAGELMFSSVLQQLREYCPSNEVTLIWVGGPFGLGVLRYYSEGRKSLLMCTLHLIFYGLQRESPTKFLGLYIRKTKIKTDQCNQKTKKDYNKLELKVKCCCIVTK